MRLKLLLLAAGMTAIMAMIDPVSRVKSMLWDSDKAPPAAVAAEPTKWYTYSGFCHEAPYTPAELYFRFNAQDLNPRLVDKDSLRVDLETTEHGRELVIHYFRGEAACEAFVQSAKAERDRMLDKYR
jgi:hypothetical protein